MVWLAQSRAVRDDIRKLSRGRSRRAMSAVPRGLYPAGSGERSKVVKLGCGGTKMVLPVLQNGKPENTLNNVKMRREIFKQRG